VAESVTTLYKVHVVASLRYPCLQILFLAGDSEPVVSGIPRGLQGARRQVLHDGWKGRWRSTNTDAFFLHSSQYFYNSGKLDLRWGSLGISWLLTNPAWIAFSITCTQMWYSVCWGRLGVWLVWHPQTWWQVLQQAPMALNQLDSGYQVTNCVFHYKRFASCTIMTSNWPDSTSWVNCNCFVDLSCPLFLPTRIPWYRKLHWSSTAVEVPTSSLSLMISTTSSLKAQSWWESVASQSHRASVSC